MKRPRSFELKKDTIKFFYEVDSYWKKHLKEKSNNTIQKIKPLYKGFSFFMINGHRELFLFRNPNNLLSYRFIKAILPEDLSEEFISRLSNRPDYFKLFYDTMCSYYFKVLKSDDIIRIHEEYKDVEYPLLDDTYTKCLAS